LGVILIAPSRRITSPLSISFSMMCFTSAAYSSGCPNREGKGTCAPSEARISSDIPRSIGVSKMPGAIVMTRMPNFASSRAMGSVMPFTPALEAAYAAWPIWPSIEATEDVFTITPRSPPGSGGCTLIFAAASRIARATQHKNKAAFTLRLDEERHLRLRLASAVSGRSAQQIVTGALDAFLESLPEVGELARHLPAHLRWRQLVRIRAAQHRTQRRCRLPEPDVPQSDVHQGVQVPGDRRDRR